MNVRDYECDMEGIVNNAVYMNYLEHARHVHLKQIGLDFAKLTASGIHLVVTRAELEYRSPLRSGDVFDVCLNVEQISPLRFCFHQEIFRQPDETAVLKARVIGTALDGQGRPSMPDEVRRALTGDAVSKQ